MSLEHLFTTSALSLSVPNTSIEFPPSGPADVWLQYLASNAQERQQAFFDEQLQSLLTLRIEHPTPDVPADPCNPPSALITFLAHLQISLEASYISSVPVATETPQTTRLSAPPRSASLGIKSSTRGGAYHPSILPPTTPHPTPATADHDRKYVAAQGTLLLTSIWGQNTSDSSHEDFALIWSESESVWVAVYRLTMTVSFLRLTFTEPLLCLTISITLRERPVTTSSTKHPFIRFLRSYDTVAIPESPTVFDNAQTQGDDDNVGGFTEVNLLEGLLAGPTFSKLGPSAINLPSTRLGIVSRQKMFALPPVNLPTPTTPSPSPATVRGKTHPTLRKSYRKTLQTVSGFRVRMRTVFVPSVVLSSSQEEQHKMTSGNEERTVVLCVEIENSGESGQGIGFEVEQVDVAISGDEAKATLITWGQENFITGEAVFPLKIAQWAQYNLLYAVTFLRSPEELDVFSSARPIGNHPHTDLQRAVSINILGKPYLQAQNSTLYPTQTFSSKWNCVLDLSSQQPQRLRNLDPIEPSSIHPDVLPEPPSPFPASGLQTSKPNPLTGLLSDTRLPLLAGRVLKLPTPRFSSIPMNSNPARSSIPQAGLPGQYGRSPTTYSAPPIPDHDRPYPGFSSRTQTPPAFDSPMTPAYPAFPPKSAVPQTPMFHAPVVSETSIGVAGPSLEARRLRVSVTAGAEPPTPVPYHPDGGAFATGQRSQAGAYESVDNGDTIVISVGLSNVIQSGGVGSRARQEEEEIPELGPGRIYPLDSFTLDIFVFNKSERTRRLEINCLERRRRRQGEENGSSGARKKMGYPGIIPMEGRVRIGPLLPSACQSVRMEFLAVSPGVHSIEALTLTDVESAYSINLRSVMDVVVHEPDD